MEKITHMMLMLSDRNITGCWDFLFRVLWEHSWWTLERQSLTRHSERSRRCDAIYRSAAICTLRAFWQKDWAISMSNVRNLKTWCQIDHVSTFRRKWVCLNLGDLPRKKSEHVRVVPLLTPQVGWHTQVIISFISCHDMTNRRNTKDDTRRAMKDTKQPWQWHSNGTATAYGPAQDAAVGVVDNFAAFCSWCDVRDR